MSTVYHYRHVRTQQINTDIEYQCHYINEQCVHMNSYVSIETSKITIVVRSYNHACTLTFTNLICILHVQLVTYSHLPCLCTAVLPP